jgi:diamine N-acetyltransferase
VEFLIRLCGPGDEEAVSLINQATILETYAGLSKGTDLVVYVSNELSVDVFKRMLSSERVRVWTVETIVGGCTVGCAVVLSEEGGEPFSTMKLERLYIFYRFHGQGLGKKLMNEVLSFARQRKTNTISLRVHAENAHAIGFYEHYGFKATGSEMFHAGEGSYRVLVMQLAL